MNADHCNVARFGRLAWSVLHLLVLALAVPMFAFGQDAETDPKKVEATREAIVLWIGLAIFCVVILGAGLIWGVARGAKWAKRKHEPVHTEMPDIWFQNPPEKRRPEKP